MALISSSAFSKEEGYLKDTLKYFDKPEDVLKQNIKHMRPLAVKLKNMMMTPGWEEFVKPFLEREANPSRLFALFKKKESPERDYELGRAEGFSNFLNLINNIVNSLDVELEEEPEKKEEEEPEEEIEDSEVLPKERD